MAFLILHLTNSRWSFDDKKKKKKKKVLVVSLSQSCVTIFTIGWDGAGVAILIFFLCRCRCLCQTRLTIASRLKIFKLFMIYDSDKSVLRQVSTVNFSYGMQLHSDNHFQA